VLEKLYCHSDSYILEVGKWYYCKRYVSATSEKDSIGKEPNRFDIKFSDDPFSNTMLSMRICDMGNFFYTKEEYRDKILSKIL